MPRYIDADLLKQRFCDSCLDHICLFNDGKLCDECKIISTFEAADVAPVVHAHWIIYEHTMGKVYQCRNCMEVVNQKWAYCPYCGAKMDENER